MPKAGLRCSAAVDGGRGVGAACRLLKAVSVASGCGNGADSKKPAAISFRAGWQGVSRRRQDADGICQR